MIYAASGCYVLLVLQPSARLGASEGLHTYYPLIYFIHSFVLPLHPSSPFPTLDKDHNLGKKPL